MPNNGKYSKKLCKKIENQLAKGKNVSQLCNNLDICEASYYRWKAEGKRELLEAIKKGKKRAIQTVENKLFQRATGLEYFEETLIKKKEIDGFERIETKKVKKYSLPDVTAQIFFLKNRNPSAWSDKQKIEMPDKIKIVIEGI